MSVSCDLNDESLRRDESPGLFFPLFFKYLSFSLSLSLSLSLFIYLSIFLSLSLVPLSLHGQSQKELGETAGRPATAIPPSRRPGDASDDEKQASLPEGQPPCWVWSLSGKNRERRGLRRLYCIRRKLRTEDRKAEATDIIIEKRN